MISVIAYDQQDYEGFERRIKTANTLNYVSFALGFALNVLVLALILSGDIPVEEP